MKNILQLNFTVITKYIIMNRIKIFEWFSVGLVTFGTYLSAFDITPYNKYVFIIANLCWIVLGFIWKKNSLIFLSVTMEIIYLIGLYA